MTKIKKFSTFLPKPTEPRPKTSSRTQPKSLPKQTDKSNTENNKSVKKSGN